MVLLSKVDNTMRASVVVLALCMLLTGTINTIATKYQVTTHVAATQQSMHLTSFTCQASGLVGVGLQGQQQTCCANQLLSVYHRASQHINASERLLMGDLAEQSELLCTSSRT